ncbi:hypothetical protein SAMN02745945_01722 [Peptoclostridium litorale DSM 5388]|uniref:Uncharacterized protein n=1 Tax=Peptoclostridium litorale DSM 5388 TaxID=1121324 RepID=A0A069RG62_PEPLI|nr:hypothetical protein [Peptoclostridium litorale]KDR96006.1 hypothetical protein CLIT_5c00160 [Peptoclostridium litorale DSM 5388]SIO06794.1 hypothetical protein SAMN02745945_01722 [Peptoclostridium litorale DSM 5388]
MITIDIQQPQKKKKRHKTGRGSFKFQNDLNSYISGKYINETYKGKSKRAAMLFVATVAVAVVAGMKFIGII